MHEMLFYMYSGRSPHLQQMALDLLAVADRFGLIGLKEMADQVEYVAQVLLQLHFFRESKFLKIFSKFSFTTGAPRRTVHRKRVP